MNALTIISAPHWDPADLQVVSVTLFELHQQANAHAQRDFDAYVKTLNMVEHDYDIDDSDASHFIISGDDAAIHWIIGPVAEQAA